MSFLRIFKACSLRTRFVLPTAALLAMTLISISTYLNDKHAASIRKELETSGETMIRMLAVSAEGGVLFESSYELENVLRILSKFEGVQYAAVYNSDGIVLSDTGSYVPDDYTRLEELDHTRHSHEAYDCQDYYIKDKKNNQYIELNYPVVTRIKKFDRENLGITSQSNSKNNSEYITEEIGSIKLVLSLEDVIKSIVDARNAAFVLTFFVLMIALVILTMFIRVITQPIKQMVEATDLISRGDLTQKINLDRTDEIGHLAETFNRMIDSLQQSRNEIEKYNKTLEEKIIERTLALEEAQAQLAQSEKLSAIGQLAAGVAHELNNPLGGILGYAQFTLEKMKKIAPDQITEKEINSYIRYISDIENQARRCKNIVQNLLRFSRSSKCTEMVEIDINSIVEDTTTFIEHQLTMNQIDLRINLDNNIPEIQGNSGQLQQVLTNMILNAMHASPQGTTIEVATRFCPPLGEFAGTVEILCIDQGGGIAEENIKKIFEPFFTTKDVGKGTGLGLSVSYGIVKEHGGEIKVDSKINEGTTFTIILPVQKSDQSVDITDITDYGINTKK